MPRRREWRVPFAISVRVFGTSRSGQVVSGTAQILEISRGGVRLSHAEFLNHTGDSVTLHYQQRRAKYRVVWVGGPDGPERGLAGLELLPGQPHIWGLDPGTGKPDTFGLEPRQTSKSPPAVPVPSSPAAAAGSAGEQPSEQDRRRNARYDCDRAVACWRTGITVPVWGKLRDLSLNGCSVEAPVTFEVGADLRMVLLVYGIKIRATGIVRRSEEKIMGVQLTSIHRDDYDKFQAVVNRLAQPADGSYVPVNMSDALLRQIEEWLEDREVLSRGDLHQLLAAAKKNTGGTMPQ